MSSSKRPYNETISSSSSASTDNKDYIVNIVVEEEQSVEKYMDIEEHSSKNRQAEEENAISRRKRLNTDNDTPFLRDNKSSSLTSTSFKVNSNTTYFLAPSPSNTSYRFPTADHPSDNVKSSYISPKDSFNSNKNSLKVLEDTKALSPIDLLMSSPPISTSTPKNNRASNTSDSSLTLTTRNPDAWDFTDDYSSHNNLTKNTNTSNDSPHRHCFTGEYINNSSDSDNGDIFSTRNSNINNHFSNSHIRTNLTKFASSGPFEPIYSQIYDDGRIVIDAESFNYLVQLFEFCDENSRKLQSIITSTLTDLVLLLTNQLDGFDIPFIEHYKWNGSHFYGPIDVVTLLDDLDDGLGLSSAEYFYYDRYNTLRSNGSVLQCGCRRTYRSFASSSPPDLSNNITNNVNDIQNNELRHAVLDIDAEKEAQNFLEFLAEEDDRIEEIVTEQEESDSFTEISKESDCDDDDSFIQDLVSTSIRQPTIRTDTFGNPINQTRTNFTRHISRPNDGNETDDSLNDYIIDSGESTFEEIDHSDIESTVTDSTIEDGWHNISGDI